MPSGNDLLNLAVAAAQRAGEYLRTATVPDDPAGWTAKGRADWVTEVDRTAEGLIVETLRAGAPDSDIIGEELSPELRDDGLVWIVDPLDGTTNFIHRYPCYAVSIGAAIDGIFEVAAVLHVPLNRLSTATRGGGAWENGQRLRVSAITSPGHALVGTGLPYRDFSRMNDYVAQLDRITRQVTGIRRPGSAAIDLTDVAAGRFDGFWEQRLSAWDIAAGTLLVREAGGRVTDAGGRDIGVEHSGVVAGNPAIHGWLLETLAGERTHG
jgi:myo-inositol-1(or 4)-monophosphatase